jgi:hypothetical protein
MFGFPFRDPGQTVLETNLSLQSAHGRLVQPGRQAHTPAISGLPSSQEHRLFKGDGQLLSGHTKIVAPNSYRAQALADRARLMLQRGEILHLGEFWKCRPTLRTT